MAKVSRPPQRCRLHERDGIRPAEVPPAGGILVLGAGPAGAVTAIGLARLGHRVRVVHRPRRPATIEGLSERAFETLAVAGCVRAQAAAGPPVMRSANWGELRGAANRERVIDRARFDAALVDDLRASGIDVIEGRAGACSFQHDLWRVRVHRSRGIDDLRAGFLVEARGRSAPQGRMERDSAPAATAIAHTFAMPAGAPARTALAAYAGGWAWFAADGGGRGVLQIVTGAGGAQSLPGRSGLPGHFAAQVAALPESAEWLAGARATGMAHARPAAARLVQPVAGPHWIRVGDAAATIDPLSGHGIFAAAGSGLAAVAVVNTLCRRPADAPAALQFHHERTAQGFLHHARIGREYYRMERRWVEQPFWRARRDWPDAGPAPVREAGAGLRIDTRPVVVNGFVEVREVMITRDHPRGVLQVADVPLVPLLRAAVSEGIHPQRFAVRFDRPQADVMVALDWLCHRGLIVGTGD